MARADSTSASRCAGAVSMAPRRAWAARLPAHVRRSSSTTAEASTTTRAMGQLGITLAAFGVEGARRGAGVCRWGQRLDLVQPFVGGRQGGVLGEDLDHVGTQAHALLSSAAGEDGMHRVGYATHVQVHEGSW